MQLSPKFEKKLQHQNFTLQQLPVVPTISSLSFHLYGLHLDKLHVNRSPD